MAEILIADDEEDILELLTFALEKKGHNISTVTDGGIVIDELKKKKYELVIMDIMMPNLDGFNIALNLSKDEELRNIPVIMISALKPAKDLFEKFSQVKGFFTKPFETDLLVLKVDEILN